MNYVEQHGQLSVSGNKIINKNNNIVCFSGPSLFWSNTNWGGEKYYNSDTIKNLNIEWNAPIIRVPMGVDEQNGYLQDINNKTKVETVIDAAIENGKIIEILYC